MKNRQRQTLGAEDVIHKMVADFLFDLLVVGAQALRLRLPQPETLPTAHYLYTARKLTHQHTVA
jgi:hypothetical protein